MNSDYPKTVVIALGGNAITREFEEGNVYQQFANTRRSLVGVLNLIEEGAQVILTHGNLIWNAIDNIIAHNITEKDIYLCVPSLSWVAGFSLVIYLFGFHIAIPLFSFAYLKWRRRSWLTAAVFAVAALAFSYAVFDIFLEVPLYRGIIFGAH